MDVYLRNGRVMVFNSLSFLVVFSVLFLLYYLISAKRQACRDGSLLLVSYLPCANQNPACALILLGVTLVTYLFARRIEDEKRCRATLMGTF